MELMRKTAARGRSVQLFLNFHSPSPENDSYLPPLNPSLLTAGQRIGVERLSSAIAANSPPLFGFSVDKQSFDRVSAWYGDDIEHRADVFVLRQFGAESVLVEAAYHASAAGIPSSPERLRALGTSVLRGVEAYLLGQSQGRIGVYDSLPSVYRQSHGWPIWRVPRFVRMRFTGNHALAVSDDPSAFAYFGLPRPCPIADTGKISVLRRAGGTARVVWCCYDEQQARLLAMPMDQVIAETESPQPLIAPSDLPEAARYLRPSFLLEGSFRPFEVSFRP